MIFYNKTRNDIWTEADYSMPVIAKFVTGGGNTPLVIKRLAMWCIGNGQAHQWQLQNNVGALNCMHDQQIVLGGAAEMDAVRRLTPLECERLQGFPDGWTDIGEWTDSKGKKHKDADSPRYKALGNSIATPFWFYLMRRIAAMYERPATLGSLFDGIGGFPYVWERCNGPKTAIWASEIEEFPIAVTKLRFGDDPEQRWERLVLQEEDAENGDTVPEE